MSDWHDHSPFLLSVYNILFYVIHNFIGSKVFSFSLPFSLFLTKKITTKQHFYWHSIKKFFFFQGWCNDNLGKQKEPSSSGGDDDKFQLSLKSRVNKPFFFVLQLQPSNGYITYASLWVFSLLFPTQCKLTVWHWKSRLI